MKVRDIMTAEVACAEPDFTLDEIATMMRDEDTGVIPVVDEDELIGVITDRDIVIRCIAEGKDPTDLTAEEFASEDLQTIAPDADSAEAARIMSQHQIRRLPVVEDGRLLGMVSIGDLAVKERNEDLSKQALQEVSRGVKLSRGQKAEPAPISAPKAKGVSGGGRQQRLEGGQGISNQSARREEGRQQRVTPIRPEAKTPARGTSRRKAS